MGPSTLSLGIPRRECLMVLSDFFRQGFRMITFDRQAEPLQNFNRSHVMVIGRSVSFSDPARPPGWGRGAPQTPQNPPPPKKKICMRFRTPGTFLKKKFSRDFFFLRPQEDVFAKKKFQLLKTSRTIYI